MTSTALKPAPGRPKDLEKRAAILEAAKRLFPKHGFEGTSMDAIATEAGVSKLTVYSHFKDKDTLFHDTVAAKCAEGMPHEIFDFVKGAPVRAQLHAIAHKFFELIVSPEAMSLHRLMTAQPEPKLGKLFWEAGPRKTQAELARFLRAEIEAGVLDIPDPDRAASMFMSLLKGEPFARLSYMCCPHFGEADIEAHIDAVVDFFLRAYGTDKAR
jgi:TetR/AcrR family transcriptional regulator, mexJK operon transcriptional repressor